ADTPAVRRPAPCRPGRTESPANSWSPDPAPAETPPLPCVSSCSVLSSTVAGCRWLVTGQCGCWLLVVGCWSNLVFTSNQSPVTSHRVYQPPATAFSRLSLDARCVIVVYCGGVCGGEAFWRLFRREPAGLPRIGIAARGTSS